MNGSTFTRKHFLVIYGMALTASLSLLGQQADSSFVVSSVAIADSSNLVSPNSTAPPQQEIKSAPPKRKKTLPYELSGAYSYQDKLKKDRLDREQTRIRAQLDILSTQLLYIDEKLREPKTRVALSKKVQAPRQQTVGGKSPKTPQRNPVKIDARSIDVAAIPLIREKGLSLDQARLHIIEQFTPQQVATFYASLEKADRYALYDIIEVALEDGDIDFELARKSAIFFHFYALK